ncbi:MAG: hypothetical protein AAF223_19580, partial [Bacteroidota bacterium]
HHSESEIKAVGDRLGGFHIPCYNGSRVGGVQHGVVRNDDFQRLGRILLINTDLTSNEGVQQFFSIWDKLEEYQQKLN